MANTVSGERWLPRRRHTGGLDTNQVATWLPMQQQAPSVLSSEIQSETKGMRVRGHKKQHHWLDVIFTGELCSELPTQMLKMTHSSKKLTVGYLLCFKVIRFWAEPAVWKATQNLNSRVPFLLLKIEMSFQLHAHKSNRKSHICKEDFYSDSQTLNVLWQRLAFKSKHASKDYDDMQASVLRGKTNSK